MYYNLSNLRDEKKKKFNRVLPISELLTDRWEKARYLKAGKGSNVYDSSYVYGDVKIGKDVFIGGLSCIEGVGGLKIGDQVDISFGVHIYTHNSVEQCLSGGKIPLRKAPVSIGSRTYVGPMVVIAKGIKIGKECVIGAFTLVNKNIPNNSIVFGTPGKIVGKTIISKGKVKLEYFK